MAKAWSVSATARRRKYQQPLPRVSKKLRRTSSASHWLARRFHTSPRVRMLQALSCCVQHPQVPVLSPAAQSVRFSRLQASTTSCRNPWARQTRSTSCALPSTHCVSWKAQKRSQLVVVCRSMKSLQHPCSARWLRPVQSVLKKRQVRKHVEFRSNTQKPCAIRRNPDYHPGTLGHRSQTTAC